MTIPPTSASASFYDDVGGAATFRALVSEFYSRVAADPVLRRLYPDDELPEAEVRLRMFLEQYWGGPRTYSEQRGHPRLRMRHAPFAIGEPERDAWLRHMRAALDVVELSPQHDATLWNYLVSAAHSLVNSGPTAPLPPAGATRLDMASGDSPQTTEPRPGEPDAAPT